MCAKRCPGQYSSLKEQMNSKSRKVPMFNSHAERALYMLGARRLADVESSGKEHELATVLTRYCAMARDVHCFSGLIATSKSFHAAVVDALKSLPVPQVEGVDRHGRPYALVSNTPGDRFLSSTKRCHNCGASTDRGPCNIDAMLDPSYISVFLCDECAVNNNRVRHYVYDGPPQRYCGTIDGNLLIRFLPQPSYSTYKYPFDERVMSDVCGADFHLFNVGYERHFFHRQHGVVASSTLQTINLAPHLQEPLKVLAVRLAEGDERHQELYNCLVSKVNETVSENGLPSMDLPETWKEACKIIKCGRLEDWHVLTFLRLAEYEIRHHEPRSDGVVGNGHSREFFINNATPSIVSRALCAHRAYIIHNNLSWLCRHDHWDEMCSMWPSVASALVNGHFQVAYMSQACWESTRGRNSGEKEMAVELLYHIKSSFHGSRARVVTSAPLACAALGVDSVEDAIGGRWVTVSDVCIVKGLFQSDESPIEMKGRLADMIFNLDASSSRRNRKRCAHSTYRMTTLKKPRLLWCTACSKRGV